MTRRSRSATILSILEQYFEGGRKLGKILIDMGALSPEELRVALRLQRESMSDQRIGEILRKEGYVMEVDVDRALQVQGSGSDSIY